MSSLTTMTVTFIHVSANHPRRLQTTADIYYVFPLKHELFCPILLLSEPWMSLVARHWWGPTTLYNSSKELIEVMRRRLNCVASDSMDDRIANRSISCDDFLWPFVELHIRMWWINRHPFTATECIVDKYIHVPTHNYLFNPKQTLIDTLDTCTE